MIDGVGFTGLPKNVKHDIQLDVVTHTELWDSWTKRQTDRSLAYLERQRMSCAGQIAPGDNVTRFQRASGVIASAHRRPKGVLGHESGGPCSELDTSAQLIANGKRLDNDEDIGRFTPGGLGGARLCSGSKNHGTDKHRQSCEHHISEPMVLANTAAQPRHSKPDPKRNPAPWLTKNRHDTSSVS